MVELGIVFAALAALTWLAVAVWGAYVISNVIGLVRLLNRSEIIFISKVGLEADVSIFTHADEAGGVSITARPVRDASVKTSTSVTGSAPR